MNKHLVFLALTVTLLSGQLLAQETKENALQSGTIDEQFDYIYGASNNYQEYKVVRRSFLDRLKSNMLDSIQTMRGEVLELKKDVQTRQDSIRSIQNLLAQTESEKQEAIAAKDNFNFLGLGIQKGVYSTFMWILVGALAAALALFSFKYFRSFSKIKKAEKDLAELQEEFEQHRKNTLERERKLKRELIDAQMGKSCLENSP
jgi:predicted  nucleic acid-binding Zn-ribbon protein